MPPDVFELHAGIDQRRLESLPKMDEPKTFGILKKPGTIATVKLVKPEHFLARSDLR